MAAARLPTLILPVTEAGWPKVAKTLSDPARAFASGNSPTILGESADSPVVKGLAPAANPRTGSAADRARRWGGGRGAAPWANRPAGRSASARSTARRVRCIGGAARLRRDAPVCR